LTIFEWIDYAGTFVFAISGALAGKNKKLDAFGVSIIALVTAIGGGTLRDVLLGATPVGWMKHLEYLYIIFFGILVSFFFEGYFSRLRKTLFLFDTLGIAVFTIFGFEKTYGFGLHPIICMMMAMVSAVFGGVIRDILCNEVPLIFRKEIYATACLGGAFVYWLLKYLLACTDMTSALVSIIFIVTVRILAIRHKWSLHF